MRILQQGRKYFGECSFVGSFISSFAHSTNTHWSLVSCPAKLPVLGAQGLQLRGKEDRNSWMNTCAMPSRNEEEKVKEIGEELLF